MYATTPTDDPSRFTAEVTRSMLVAPGGAEPFVMGGAAFACAVDAIEQAAGRPLVWAAAQFLSSVPTGSTMVFDVDFPVVGRTTAQASLTARVGDQTFLSVMAALGHRDDEPVIQLPEMPDVPSPDACRDEPHPEAEFGNLHSAVEKRRIPTPPESGGRTLKWRRFIDRPPVTAGLLALLAG